MSTKIFRLFCNRDLTAKGETPPKPAGQEVGLKVAHYRTGGTAELRGIEGSSNNSQFGMRR
ncbi:hypothetical protein NCHU2750_47270 (plasmid) [Neorhizobium sp. NCHU2750]|nr:hypothetical protein NCHU2750_47270 [Neorhizobium sp. NCHU2750]